MRTRDQVVFVMGPAFVYSCAHTRQESIGMTSALFVCLSICVSVRLLFQVMVLWPVDIILVEYRSLKVG
jgi:hypothetical protein